MAIDSVKPVQTAEKPAETPVPAAPVEKSATETSRFGPAYILGQLHGDEKPAVGASGASASVNSFAKHEIPSGAASEAPKQKESETSAFGPAYIRMQDRKPTQQQMTVPFTPSSLGETLAALPPMNPIGAASLTRLSLVKLIQPDGGDATKSKS